MRVIFYAILIFFFFFNDTATTEIYTLSLHDALPISPAGLLRHAARAPAGGTLRRPSLRRQSRQAGVEVPGPPGRLAGELRGRATLDRARHQRREVSVAGGPRVLARRESDRGRRDTRLRSAKQRRTPVGTGGRSAGGPGRRGRPDSPRPRQGGPARRRARGRTLALPERLRPRRARRGLLVPRQHEPQVHERVSPV